MKFKVIKKQNNSNHCIVCGLQNNLGLKASFYELENKMLACTVTGISEHQSYPGRMHGGLICALLDEVIGRAIMIDEPKTWGVTGELSIKYRKPVPLDEEIICVGKIVKNSSRIFIGSGFVEDKNGTLLATATATYVKIPLEKIAQTDEHNEDFGWKLFIDKTAPDCLDIHNMEFLEN